MLVEILKYAVEMGGDLDVLDNCISCNFRNNDISSMWNYKKLITNFINNKFLYI